MLQRKLINLFVNHERGQRPSRWVPLVELTGLELLDRRVLPAVTATCSAAQGVLTVIGDARDNSIVVSSDAAGSILVNSGAVTVLGRGIDGCNHNEAQAKGGLKVQSGIKVGVGGCGPNCYNHNEAQVRDA